MKTIKKDLQVQDTQILSSDQNLAEHNQVDKNLKHRPLVRDSSAAAVGVVAGVVGSSLVSDQSSGAVGKTELNETENTIDPSTQNSSVINDPSTVSPNSNEAESYQPEPKQEASPSSEEVILTTAHGAHIAHVEDSLTFEDAFAEARNQVGPGGVFSYNGHKYNTYYKEEWDSMSSDQKQEYYASVDMGSSTNNDQVLSNGASEPVHETSYGTAPDSNEDEVYVLGVGSATIEGHEVYVGHLAVGGEDVIVLDVDKDGTFDYAVADANHDGTITPNEVVDISKEQLTVIQMQESLNADQEVFTADADIPDYTNDADISQFS